MLKSSQTVHHPGIIKSLVTSALRRYSIKRKPYTVFDKNNDEFIATEEMKQVMGNLGQKVTDQELEETIRECDMNGDGKVDYNEFVEMMDSLFIFIEATMASS